MLSGVRDTGYRTSRFVDSRARRAARAIGANRTPRRALASDTMHATRPAASLRSVEGHGLHRRRALLAGSVLLLAPRPPPAQANPLDDLVALRHRTNAKVLTGTVVLAKLRLRDAALVDGEAARALVSSAALDCLDVRPNLQAYSGAREVCTFSIVARSVTSGPAARWSDDSREAQETAASLQAVRQGFEALDARLAAGEAAASAYDALNAALDRFSLAVCGALSVTPAELL